MNFQKTTFGPNRLWIRNLRLHMSETMLRYLSWVLLVLLRQQFEKPTVLQVQGAVSREIQYILWLCSLRSTQSSSTTTTNVTLPSNTRLKNPSSHPPPPHPEATCTVEPNQWVHLLCEHTEETLLLIFSTRILGIANQRRLLHHCRVLHHRGPFRESAPIQQPENKHDKQHANANKNKASTRINSFTHKTQSW